MTTERSKGGRKRGMTLEEWEEAVGLRVARACASCDHFCPEWEGEGSCERGPKLEGDHWPGPVASDVCKHYRCRRPKG